MENESWGRGDMSDFLCKNSMFWLVLSQSQARISMICLTFFLFFSIFGFLKGSFLKKQRKRKGKGEEKEKKKKRKRGRKRGRKTMLKQTTTKQPTQWSKKPAFGKGVDRV